MAFDLIIGVFVWLLGLCIGSFLNVVIYRLPAGLSINQPARSFCPHCHGVIAWYDNIPVLSWLLLRARCRRCGAPISLQYPLVEALTGLSFVLVYYLLFVARARVGVEEPAHPADWPLLLAWLVLVGALIACATMDVVSYMVDVRVTYVAIVAGIVLHALWPRPGMLVPVGRTPLAAGALGALLASVLMLWRTVWRVPDDEPQADTAVPTASGASHAVSMVGRVAIVVFIGLTLWLLTDTVVARGPTPPGRLSSYGAARIDRPDGPPTDVAVTAAVLAIFATIVLAGGQPRAADADVKTAIEQERPHARRQALCELLWLAPPILVGAGTTLLLLYWPPANAGWDAAATWSVCGFAPLGGAALAVLSAMVGAAAGWVLRIVFTLVFGREAMGVGDIYILAAAGACAGCDMALLGLLLAVGVAIAGYVLGLLLKRSVIIPFGPWLAIGFVLALWWNEPGARIARHYWEGVTSAWTHRPDLCWVAGGLMLIGSAAAVGLAHVARRLVERVETK